MVNKTKNKNSFFCFFNFVRSLRAKKRRENLSGKSARQSCAEYLKKNKKLEFCTLYFVSHKNGLTFRILYFITTTNFGAAALLLLLLFPLAACLAGEFRVPSELLQWIDETSQIDNRRLRCSACRISKNLFSYCGK